MDYKSGMMRYSLLLILFLAGCKNSNNNDPVTPPEKPVVVVNTPPFNPDSAFAYVKKQVEFILFSFILFEKS